MNNRTCDWCFDKLYLLSHLNRIIVRGGQIIENVTVPELYEYVLLLINVKIPHRLIGVFYLIIFNLKIILGYFKSNKGLFNLQCIHIINYVLWQPMCLFIIKKFTTSSQVQLFINYNKIIEISINSKFNRCGLIRIINYYNYIVNN